MKEPAAHVQEAAKEAKAQLAELIKNIDGRERETLRFCHDAGRLLTTVRKGTPHGDWLPFLAHIRMDERRARRYMVLAKAGLTKLAAFSSVTDALAHLKAAKKKAKAQAAEEERERVLADKRSTTCPYCNGIGKAPPDVGTIPKELDTIEFRHAWSEWQAERRAKRQKAYTPTGADAQLRRLASIGTVRAVSAIRHSIQQGYAGIFEAGQRPTDQFSGLKEWAKERKNGG